MRNLFCQSLHTAHSPPSMRQWLLVILSISLLAWVSGSYVRAGEFAIVRPDSTDFYKFFLSANRVNNGQSMYWLVPPRRHIGDPCHPGTPLDQARKSDSIAKSLRIEAEDPCLGPNLNPPIFMVAVHALSSLPFDQAWWRWTVVSMFSGMLGIALLVSALIAKNSHRKLTVLMSCTALILYYPTLANFALGQVGMFVLLLLVLTWRKLRQTKPLWAGFWLGLVVCLKPFLVTLLICLAIQKQGRTCLSASITILSLGMLGWFLYGTDVHRHYWLLASDVTWNGANLNGAWAGVAERFFSGQASSVLPQGSWQARTAATALSLLTLLVMCWSIHRSMRTSTSVHSEDTTMALGLPTALLVSPLGWAYYFPVLALSWAILWRHTAYLPNTRAWRIGLLIPIALSMAPIVNRPSPRPDNPTVWWGVDSIYCYALLSLLVIGLAAFRGAQTKVNEQSAHKGAL